MCLGPRTRRHSQQVHADAAGPDALRRNPGKVGETLASPCSCSHPGQPGTYPDPSSAPPNLAVASDVAFRLQPVRTRWNRSWESSPPAIRPQCSSLYGCTRGERLGRYVRMPGACGILVPADAASNHQEPAMANTGLERRLSAIMAADVVGYSRLVEADEAGTLTSLRNLRKIWWSLCWPSIAAGSSS